MLLVVASEWDRRGPLLRKRWASADARLMTPRDLQRAGWRHEPDRPSDGVAVVAGVAVGVGEIDGVCTLLPCVGEADVVKIRPVDRAYVASEMTAFLCAWLDALDCPVTNPPTPSCLCGPAWSPERWRCAAAAAGIPTAQEAGTAVSVVGDQVFGAQTDEQGEVARTLARATDLSTLRVTLGGPRHAPGMATADLWLDAYDARIADAARDLLEARP